MSALIESIHRADDGDEHAQMLALCEQGLREQPASALLWALRARYHDKRGAHAARQADLDRALTLDPHCADAIRVQATARYNAGERQEAWRVLRDALQRTPSHFGLLMAQAYLLINDRQLDQAIQCWTRAAQLRPSAGAPHCYIASNLANAGRHAEAEPHFRRATSLAPGNGMFLYDAGNTYRSLGDLHNAIAMFDRARAILGEQNAIQHNRASCLQALERHADAVEEWTSLLRREPDWDWPLEGKARSLHRLGRADEAAPLWRHLDALSDSGWEGRREQAREYVRSGDPELAEHALQGLDPMNCGDAQLLFVAGNAQRDQRNWDEALEYYLQGYELAPDNDFLPGNAADMLNRLERHDEALPLSEVAISLDPDWLKWRRARIEALTHLGRADEAVADADRAMARWPDDGALHAERINALIAAKRHDEALTACDRLIAIDPDYRSWALFSRGQTYSEMKRHAESAMAYRQAAASYQQNGKPQYQELSLNNALAAEQAAAAPRGLLSRLFRRN
ncbi:tetratricopeptide repeat protein [Achromobacter xylosoxidans]|uniref:Tetratricopeptide repeat protein n=1 Tax=Alcaligenes xylosoxydans xylosoxydans TaxID=85698 RepID=A0A424WIQ3_ALCXX|nr:tetratricopeptide repeat protein [Achromobacter xylosoxidans]MBC9903630.1 tetratricopeptide repeat protein [Achromobacter xylosoxidans]MBD0866814.1 tetratricopeptide repeat protein [Achromobacter xylosoxidans]QNP84828.1 tetratricopeptide repeat protein [Achromobacter xylosoxidans]RPJ93049.1 tetratricopeptide repeat protein [Achromobacter xylosoxidans]